MGFGYRLRESCADRRGGLVCVCVFGLRGGGGGLTVIMVLQFVLKRMINPSLWFSIHLMGGCSISSLLCEHLNKHAASHATLSACLASQHKFVCTVVQIYTHAMCTISVCLCYMCVNNSHSNLWECRMSNTEYEPLFQGNIISYFYVEFTLARSALIRPPPSFFTAQSKTTLYTRQPQSQEARNDSLCNLLCSFECCNLDANSAGIIQIVSRG